MCKLCSRWLFERNVKFENNCHYDCCRVHRISFQKVMKNFKFSGEKYKCFKRGARNYGYEEGAGGVVLPLNAYLLSACSQATSLLVPICNVYH